MAVAQPGEPAGGFLRQAVDVLPHCVQEHQLAELGQDRLAAGARGMGLLQGDADQAVREIAPGLVAAHVEQARHCIQDRVERPRSEEHTSELQSLMRISYAVFCLKKKTKEQEIY